MEGLQLRNRNGIIISLDQTNLDAAVELVKTTRARREVDGYKIGGATLFLGAGYDRPLREIVDSVLSAMKPDQALIYDHQKAGDIRRTDTKFYENATRYRFHGVIVFPRSAVSLVNLIGVAANPSLPRPIVGSKLTEDEVFEGHEKIYKVAASLDVKDFVIPNKSKMGAARELKAFRRLLRNVTGGNFYFPGVSSAKDVERIVDVFEWGVHPIIGNRIYNSPDPAAAVKEFADVLA